MNMLILVIKYLHVGITTLFFLFKRVLHDPQGFDLLSHTISLMEKFPY